MRRKTTLAGAALGALLLAALAGASPARAASVPLTAEIGDTAPASVQPVQYYYHHWHHHWRHWHRWHHWRHWHRY